MQYPFSGRLPSDVLQYINTFSILKWLVDSLTFHRWAIGSKILVGLHLYFMHVFRGFPEDHLFFSVHLAGHPITARYIFVWLHSFWSAALLMFSVFSMCFHGFGCDHWLPSPLPTSKCIYPLDGFMCTFRYPTNVFVGNQRCPHLKFNQDAHWLKEKKTKNTFLLLCGMYFFCLT